MIQVRVQGSEVDFLTQIIEFSVNGEPVFFFHSDSSIHSQRTKETLLALVDSLNSRQFRQPHTSVNDPIEFRLPMNNETRVFTDAYRQNRPIHYCGKDWLVTKANIVLESPTRLEPWKNSPYLEISLVRV